jgi:polar amino acid transport system substrate-binding protein
MLPGTSLRAAAMSALAFAFTLSWCVAYAQGNRAVIKAETITNNPPYESKDPTSNKLVGFEIDLVEAIAAKMGARVDWIESSWPQMSSLNSIKTQRADIALGGLADTAERREMANLLDHVSESAVFITLRANAGQFPSVETLCGKRVAVVRSSALWASAFEKWNADNCANANKPSLIKVDTDGSPQSRLELTQGRVDAALQNLGAVVYQNTVDGNRYLPIGEPVARQQFGIAFSKSDPDFGQALKKALGAVLADGTYQKLLQKWGLPNTAAPKQAMINGEQ